MSIINDNSNMSSKLFFDEINELRRRIANIEAQLTAGQHSKEITVSTVSYSHRHRRSSITDLDDDSDIDHNSLTNTHNLTTDFDHDTLTNTHNLTTDIDHGSISGLGDDDHTQYAQIAAAESISGVWSFGAVDVNFANGTTYKVEADGDAKFKDLDVTTLTVGTSVDQSEHAGRYGQFFSVISDPYIRFECGNTKAAPTQMWTVFADNSDSDKFKIRDATNAKNILSITPGTTEVDFVGVVDAAGGFKDAGVAGVDGTFPDNNGNIITVSGGIITALS